MKLFLMPKKPTWWLWLATALLLAIGLADQPVFLVAAIVLSAAQSVFFMQEYRSLAPYSVQIRIALTVFLVICLLPSLRWLGWLPVLGIIARLLFAYCTMARLLSLMPWNRTVPMSLMLVQRTFLKPPKIENAAHGLSEKGCPGGVCELEARIATR